MFVSHNKIKRMEFVDRIREKQRLNELLNGNNSSFVIIRGRRRVGKSTLIGRILQDGDVYFEADRTSCFNQMRQLSDIISAKVPGFSDAVYNNWKALFTNLNFRTAERFTLCLDEFPYLVEGDPSLPSVIQGLLDDKKNPLKYNLILCGSSQQMMYNLAHEESSPLYGRNDSDMNIKPISISFMSAALNLSPIETVENYSVFGGVPRYWKLREQSRDLRDAIMTHIMSDMGALYEEPHHLFKDDIRDTVKTFTIMSFVGNGCHRLSEIAGRCNEPATNLSRPLAKLVDLGFLEREVPFGETLKSSKKSLYQIADPFMSFYYRFTSRCRSYIELGRKEPIEKMLDREFNDFCAHWWEHICRDAVTGCSIDGILFKKASRWWGKIGSERAESQDVELDVVAESTDGTAVLIGECKWTEQENGRLLTDRLEKVASDLPFTKGKRIIVKLFLKSHPIDDVGNALLPEDVLNLTI